MIDARVVKKKFVASSIQAFETLGHTVTIANRDDIWDFTTYYPANNRCYAVWCASSIGNRKSLIRVAKTRLAQDSIRLVVVCVTISSKDQDHAKEVGYCLYSLETLLQYRNDMLGTEERSVVGAIQE